MLLFNLCLFCRASKMGHLALIDIALNQYDSLHAGLLL